MKNFVSLLCLLVLSSSVFCQYRGALYAPNQLVLKFKEQFIEKIPTPIEERNFNLPEVDALNYKYQLTEIHLTGNKRKRDTYLLTFASEQDLDRLIQEYLSTSFFVWAEPNFIGHGGGVKSMDETIPDDDYFSRQWGLVNDGSFSLSPAINDADVDMELAWDIETGSSDIIVAILDSGFKMDHPEINGRTWNNPNETTNNTDSDANGYIDDILGWDFVNNDNDPTDDHGHGTNVAGIVIANGNNGIGYAGIDWNCKVMIGKILNEDNYGFYVDWADAMYYSTDNGAKVINMSVGGSSFSNLLAEAATYAHDNGALIVCSMMNFDDEVTYYPAGFATTMGIGSTDPNDNRTSPFFWSLTSGSNFGEHIDVVAPGNYIYGLSHNSNTNFSSYWGGTSQSAPLVAGIASLLLAQDPNRTPTQLIDIIRSTAEDGVGNTTEDTPGFDKYYGYGRVNAFEALNQSLVSTQQVQEGSFSIAPNPVAPQENVRIKLDNHQTAPITLILTNSIGQQISKYHLNNEIGFVEFTIPKIPAGIYHLQCQQGIKRYSKTLFVSPKK